LFIHVSYLINLFVTVGPLMKQHKFKSRDARDIQRMQRNGCRLWNVWYVRGKTSCTVLYILYGALDGRCALNCA
jgi:hypothetical protein